MTTSELADLIIVYYAIIKLGHWQGVYLPKWFGDFWAMVLAAIFWLFVTAGAFICALNIQLDAKDYIFIGIALVSLVISIIKPVNDSFKQQKSALRTKQSPTIDK